MRRLALMAITAFALLAALLPAAASARDRNHDRIPDRWERHHHLSLKVKQTRRDQDRDGLNNLREWRNHSDPRDRDSDDDGLKDSDDVGAGTIDSFDAAAGVLVIKLARDGTLISGTVTSNTEVECLSPPMATASHDSDGDNSGPGSENSGHDDDGDDDHGDDDDEDENEVDCGIAALVAGAVVHEADLRLEDGTATWREVELRTS